MLNKKLLYTSSISLILIAVFDYFAIKLSWYWKYKSLDIPVHLIAGFGVSMMVLFVYTNFIKRIDAPDNNKKAIIVSIISVFVVCILWELYELYIGRTSISSSIYASDTLGDIVNGFIGGLISCLIFKKIKSL